MSSKKYGEKFAARYAFLRLTENDVEYIFIENVHDFEIKENNHMIAGESKASKIDEVPASILAGAALQLYEKKYKNYRYVVVSTKKSSRVNIKNIENNMLKHLSKVEVDEFLKNTVFIDFPYFVDDARNELDKLIVGEFCKQGILIDDANLSKIIEFFEGENRGMRVSKGLIINFLNTTKFIEKLRIKLFDESYTPEEAAVIIQSVAEDPLKNDYIKYLGHYGKKYNITTEQKQHKRIAEIIEEAINETS